MSPARRVACWISEKKSQKLNWEEFEMVYKAQGFELFRLDLNETLESQEPFCALVHKLTDLIAASEQGDTKSANIINKVEQYLLEHPSVAVIDPISNVKKILDRYISYRIIESTDLHTRGVYTPNCCELRTSSNTDEMAYQLKKYNVNYPFICKPILGHGSRQAHEMSIIFNSKSLSDCKVPCVAQSFVNHNAILYKIFVVGEKYCVVKRPSLKNYYASGSKTIHFDSSDISKACSQSSLSVLDPEDVIEKEFEPDDKILSVIARTLRKAFGVDLLGIDVVIDNTTGEYAIIDVNVFPGYDGFPNFVTAFGDLLSSKVNNV